MSNLTAADMSGSFLEKVNDAGMHPILPQLNWWLANLCNICLGSQVVQDRPYVGLPLVQAILKRGIGHLENKTHNFEHPKISGAPHSPRYTPTG